VGYVFPSGSMDGVGCRVVTGGKFGVLQVDGTEVGSLACFDGTDFFLKPKRLGTIKCGHAQRGMGIHDSCIPAAALGQQAGQAQF